MIATKTCTQCHTTKSTDCFSPYRPKGRTPGLQSACKPCRSEQVRNYYATNEEARLRRNTKAMTKWANGGRERYRTYMLSKKYGLTVEQFDIIVHQQDGVCAICKVERVDGLGRGLVVDHDHVTGEVRGILCSRCNSALGFFGDDLSLVEAAVDYLRTPS